MADDSREADERLADDLEALAMAAGVDVLVLIARGIRKHGVGKADFVSILTEASQFEEEARKILDSYRRRIDAAVSSAFTNLQRENEAWAAPFYEARNVEQATGSANAAVTAVTVEGYKQAARGVAANMGMTTKRVFANGELVALRDAYIALVGEAAAAAAVGAESFVGAARNCASQLASSGLRTVFQTGVAKVQYESGRTCELFSAVRQNVMQAYFETMHEQRYVQGEEFGADGVEVSAHALCAPDHQDVQGEQYTTREFDKINGSLDRPLGTMNCRHDYYPIVLGVSKPVYSREELQAFKDGSNREISFTGLSGKQLTMSRYDATQYQRHVETMARKANTEAAYLEAAGQSAKPALDRAAGYADYYKHLCKETKLYPRTDRFTYGLKC